MEEKFVPVVTDKEGNQVSYAEQDTHEEAQLVLEEVLTIGTYGHINSIYKKK